MDTGFYKTYFEVEKNHWLMKVRRKIIHDVIDDLYNDHKNSDIKILDYGSGSGFLVKELQDVGFNAGGVDMSRQAIEYGLSRGVKNLSVLENSTKLDNDHDIVLAMDVLEHIEDTSIVISEIEKSLKSGGHLIITVPAYMFLWGVQDEIAHHYRRYTRGGILSEIKSESFSFDVIRATYFNTFLFVPIAIVRLFSRLFKIKGRESDFDLNNGFLDKVFYTIFNLERKMLKYIDFPFGVSIMVVLKKK